uniref:TNFR-Cys domain-containing protein n=1 Tax=Mola mola TaxID=94237 RepID=A0A3Q3WP65_MOLML
GPGSLVSASRTETGLDMCFSRQDTAAAQPTCDPLTQYEKLGLCCKKCGPGTSMTSLGTCLEPQCQLCEKNEYQDNYNIEPKCQRQPYCDPNKNFQVPTHDSKRQTICLCKEGFHCSTKECITCVPHTACEPGLGVLAKGNHTLDTRCATCTEGTFSDEKSVDGVFTRLHIGLIVSVSVIIVLLIAAAFLMCLCRGTSGYLNFLLHGCVELCLGEEEKTEMPREAIVLITNPTDAAEEETSLPIGQSSQEESVFRTPVEDEDQLSQEMSTVDVVLTDRGNFVTQEKGKSEVLSRQESQTQTFTD